MLSPPDSNKNNSKQKTVESLRINLWTEALFPHRLKVFRELPLFGSTKYNENAIS
jgi:hypothetical protein